MSLPVMSGKGCRTSNETTPPQETGSMFDVCSTVRVSTCRAVLSPSFQSPSNSNIPEWASPSITGPAGGRQTGGPTDRYKHTDRSVPRRQTGGQTGARRSVTLSA